MKQTQLFLIYKENIKHWESLWKHQKQIQRK